jgi:hypothetical protein
VALHKGQHALLGLRHAHRAVAHSLRQPAAPVVLDAPRVHARQHLLVVVHRDLLALNHLLQAAVGDDAGHLEDGVGFYVKACLKEIAGSLIQ